MVKHAIISVIIFQLCCLVGRANSSSSFQITDDYLSNNSILHDGSHNALKLLLQKTANVNDIKIGVVGGSITMGASASKPAKRYANIIKEWFAKKYPNKNVKLYNAGIGATDSKFGAFRLKKHLLQYEPDLVIVEYSINDSENELAKETFEGIMRQLGSNKKKPAIIILAMMNAYGDNVEKQHYPLAVHYDLPMLSFKKAFEPLIVNDTIDPNLILADSVHPNDKGHEFAARIVTLYLEKIYNEQAEPCNKYDHMPVALYTDKFENLKFYEASDLNPIQNHGWELKNHISSLNQPWRLHGKPLFTKVYVSEKPLSELVIEYYGSFAAITFWKERADMGIVTVAVDNKEAAKIDGWGPQTWGGYASTVIIGEKLRFGKHTLSIKLSSKRNPESRGSYFEILAFGFGN